MKINNQNLLLLVGLGVLGALYLKSKTDFDLKNTISEAIDMVQEINPLATQLIIRIDRYLLTDTRTIGKMYLNNEYFCDTLEDTYRGQLTSLTEKVAGATAINNGTYKTEVTYSPAFNKQLPLLYNVPLFTGIRIHTGATERNTDGCILVGDYSNGSWSLNTSYVSKLVAIIPQYSLCKTVINIVK